MTNLLYWVEVAHGYLGINCSRILRRNKTMSRNSNDASIASPKVMIRVLVALVVMSLGLNILLLVPLEEAVMEDYATVFSPTKGKNNHIKNMTTNMQQEQGRQHVLNIFQEAGIPLTDEMEAALPTWSQVQTVIGKHPYVFGLDSCERFRENVPAVERMLGSAGMFNTGTNLVS